MESALEELNEVMYKPGFKGVLKEYNEKLIGFTWGYNIPKTNTSRVDFKKIRRELTSLGINPDKTFYGADTGVREEYRRQGLGKLLISERTKELENKEATIFRTLNPQMLNLYRKVFGKEAKSFPEESSYKGGRVYVFKK